MSSAKIFALRVCYLHIKCRYLDSNAGILSEQFVKTIAKTSTDYDHSADLNNLLAEAREAEARYDHETAVAAYTTALELPDLTLEEQYEVLDGRAAAYNNWGIPKQISADVKSVISLARRLDDKKILAEAMAIHGFNWRMSGSDKPSPEITQEAFLLADDLADDRLRAYCQLILAVQAWNAGEPDKAWDHLNNALEAARRSGDDDILFEVVRLHAVSHETFGRTNEALRLLSEMLSLAQKSGSELKRYKTLLLYGNTVPDLAARRDYYEQATHAEAAANYSNGSATINTAELFWKLGLYGRAQDYASRALQHAMVSGTAYSIGGASDTLGRVLLAKALFDQAGQVFQEGSKLAETSSQQKAYNVLGLAEVALARGQLAEAAAHFQSAPEIFSALGPVALSGLGVTCLAMGQFEQAFTYTKESVAFLESGQASTQYHEQQIWWRHFQVLSAIAAEDPFPALDNARQTMLADIETLSDEGLRRNYLNKVAVNRDIALTWTAEAHKRGIPLDPFTKHEPLTGHLREQFRRVVDIGARLTAQHDPQTLADFIVEEFVEMSGAERVLLLMLDENGEPYPAADFNPEDAAGTATPLVGSMRQNRQSILMHDAFDVPAGEIPELHLRSMVALPLVASDRFLGLLYGDVRQIFGRFNDADVQLLAMLAHQAAAALENANLVATLEERVERRTAELQTANENLAERNNELAVINSVQGGLAAQLDLQAIYNLVGDRLYEILDTQGLGITIFDLEEQTSTEVYSIEDGQHYPLQTHPFGSGARKLVEEKKPLHFSNLKEIKTRYPNWEDKAVEGTNFSQSLIYVPLIVGDEVFGIIDLQDDRPNAFSDSDLRLVVTLASSMSLALENARLYGEAGEARALAEEANTAKSTFISNMSHELRTPLNAILGFTRIVRRKAQGKLPEKQIDNLGKVLTSGEHLLGLINTILDIAKIEAGRMDIINTRFQIGPLIEATTMVSQPLLKSGVDLHLDIADGLPELYSDQDKIKQILLNLISNAAKFTHEGSITIHTSLGASSVWALREAPSHEPPCLVIDVTDTGIGMNQEALGRVFEEFQQADATTRKQYGGTGLGMPISKHLARLLGGDLTVASTAGEGSTFTLTLPIEEVVS